MIRNYLTVVVRQLWRHKSYVGINVLGLGTAVAMSVLAFLNWKHDADFDRFHTRGERIFRVGINKEGTGLQHGLCPAPLAMAAKTGISGVQAACRWDSKNTTVKNGTEVWNEEVHFTDGNFFDIFDFNLLSGSNDLDDKSKIWLTREMARKYFGNDNPVGASLLLYAGEPYQRTLTVGGVVEKPATNSSLQFQFLTHFDNLIGRGDQPVDASDWSWLADAVFLVLEKPELAAAVQQSLAAFVDVQKSVRTDDLKAQSYWMEAMPQVSRHRLMRANGLRENAGAEGILGPLVMALLLLLAASLNFANTSIAMSNRRLREIGLRKALGGTQRQLASLLLLEAGAIVLLSTVLGITISYWMVPGWNAMWQFMELDIDLLHNPPLWAFLAGFMVLTTLLAGGYPALYISSFRPSVIFKGVSNFGGRNLFSRFLLGVQVMIALVAIVAGVSFSRQADFIQAYPTNFSAENVIAVPLGKGQNYEVLKNALAANPDIEAIAGCRSHLSYPGYHRELEVEGRKQEARVNDASDGYLQVMEVTLLEGRLFDKNQATENGNAVVVNEMFVQTMGWENAQAIGKSVRLDTLQYAVVGVIKNVVNNFFEPVEPQVIKYVAPENCLTLVARCKPDRLLAVNTQVKSTWSGLFPYAPYQGYYNSELMAKSLEVTHNIRRIFMLFALATIVLTLTSLFALLSLHILKRMKEVAVRRVLGASGGSIAYLLHRHFALILTVGILAGCLAGSALTKLLMGNIFKVYNGVSTGALLFSAIGLAVLAASAGGMMLWRTLRTNPAEVLRSE